MVAASLVLPGPFTRALRASTWKIKGLVSSVCAHAELYHFHGILYSSVYFLYISGVYYVMNIVCSQSMVSIITVNPIIFKSFKVSYF